MLFFFHTRRVGWVGFETLGEFHTFFFFEGFPFTETYNANVECIEVMRRFKQDQKSINLALEINKKTKKKRNKKKR